MIIRKHLVQVGVTVFAAVAVVLGTAAADAATAGPARPSGAHLAPSVRSAPACNPDASSIRPSGPPRVTSGSFMATIKARGYLIAGVDQSTYHFGFLNPLDNQIEGFDIDMVRAVADAIFGNTNPGNVHFKAISDQDRIQDVQNGTVDIVAHTMTITCDRLQKLDFSSVYFDAGQRVLVQKNSGISGLAALKGQRVCATSGSDSPAAIAKAGAVPVEVTYWTDCLVLLQQGDVQAISTDDSILDGLAAQDPFTEMVGDRLTHEPYGLAIAKQHPEFVQFVNAVLEQLRADGQWADSYRRWIGSDVPPPPAAQYGS
ncbi:MAG: glutamate ABC transporter substrate-binding protein [Streptosporangiaceae bacterium]|nr:glutamate ABC transporter substrate-binding protein [Streptosporangiaceae bacterium]